MVSTERDAIARVIAREIYQVTLADYDRNPHTVINEWRAERCRAAADAVMRYWLDSTEPGPVL